MFVAKIKLFVILSCSHFHFILSSIIYDENDEILTSVYFCLWVVTLSYIYMQYADDLGFWHPYNRNVLVRLGITAIV